MTTNSLPVAPCRVRVLPSRHDQFVGLARDCRKLLFVQRENRGTRLINSIFMFLRRLTGRS